MKKPVFVTLALLAATPALADEPATNCEVFIDKVAGQQVNYHGAFGSILDAQVFIKIDARQLGMRGGVSRVVFYGSKRTIDNDGRVTSDSGAHEIALTPFFGDDYYVLHLGDIENHWWDRSNTADANQFEGAFFVEARDGSRLWTNPRGPGSNFLFDEGTATTLHDRGEIYAASVYGAARKNSVGEITQTANYNTYWNPQRCR